MTQDNVCPSSSSSPENLMHLLRDCEEVQNFWNQSVDPRHWSKFFSLGLHQRIDWILSVKNICSASWNWATFFGVAVWAIWRKLFLVEDC